jgi:hypothetical protein
LHRFASFFTYFRLFLPIFTVYRPPPQQQHPGDQDNQADVSGADHLSECGAAHCGTGCVAENWRKFGAFWAYFGLILGFSGPILGTFGDFWDILGLLVIFVSFWIILCHFCVAILCHFVSFCVI